MPHDTDIVIAGGGIAGCVLALALEQSGFSVTICDSTPAERRAAPDFDGRAYAIAPDCRRMLAVLGLWPALEADAQPIEAMRICTAERDVPPGPVALGFDAAEGSGPLAFMIEDHHLRRTALSALAERGTIRHLDPVAVSEHRPGPGSVLVRLDDGRELRAALLIACDGRHSRIAHAAGIARVERDYRQTGLVAALEHERPHEGVARQFFLPAGPLALLPLRGNRSSIVWAERPELADLIHALPERDYLDEIARRTGDALGVSRLIGKRWRYPLILTLAQRYHAPRLALVGDAAHGIHPLAGQGLNLGLRDVAAMAEVLSRAGRRGEDIGATDVLERYQQWRRFDATLLGLGCDALERGFSESGPLVRAAMDFGMRAVGRIGPLRRLLADIATGQDEDAPLLLQGRAI
ncbi:MAG: 2-octaprenyl-6-methoxyphenyl hydroxylase [Alphaproteobacteria bacterium]|nr:MAG: 2-octaprenyl-6-methoxyphenyl hydroxylase [Alphaproteobacteria bacterium]